MPATTMKMTNLDFVYIAYCMVEFNRSSLYIAWLARYQRLTTLLNQRRRWARIGRDLHDLASSCCAVRSSSDCILKMGNTSLLLLVNKRSVSSLLFVPAVISYVARWSLLLGIDR